MSKTVHQTACNMFFNVFYYVYYFSINFPSCSFYSHLPTIYYWNIIIIQVDKVMEKSSYFFKPSYHHPSIYPSVHPSIYPVIYVILSIINAANS